MNDSNYLNILVGQTIKSVYKGVDTIIPLRGSKTGETKTIHPNYVQLHSHSYTLNIYNDYQILPHSTLEELVGSTIISAEESKEEAVLLMDNGKHIKVSLKDEAYYGPEAMSLHGPDSLCVVRN